MTNIVRKPAMQMMLAASFLIFPNLSGTRARLQRPKLAQVAAEPDQTMDRPRHARQVDPDQTE
jgi:hypothetical protein